jgi:hypothetical protein
VFFFGFGLFFLLVLVLVVDFFLKDLVPFLVEAFFLAGFFFLATPKPPYFKFLVC